MTDIVTLPGRSRLRVVQRCAGIAEVIEMPRKSVGEMAAEAIAQIERQSQQAEAQRESIRTVELMRYQMELLSNQCIHLAKMYEAQGADNMPERMMSVIDGAREKMVAAFK